MERDKHLKKILKDNVIEKAPSFLSHNIMAKIHQEAAFKKSIEKPVLSKRFWYILGGLSVLCGGYSFFMFPSLSNPNLLKAAQNVDGILSNLTFDVNIYSIATIAGIFFLLFFETILRQLLARTGK